MLDKVELKDVLVCPLCHSDLTYSKSHIECSRCEKRVSFQGTALDFSGYIGEMDTDSQFQHDRMHGATFMARMNNLGRKIISSEYRPKDHIAEFVRNIPAGAVAVELGSGNRRLRDDLINVDLFLFPNVDIVADIAETPFKNDSVDCLILDSVLEHIPEPHTVIGEIYRILKPGGRVICIVPWVFPYHGYPKNYFNISGDGLEYLLRNFSDCKIEMDIGPTSALTNLLSEYFAVALSGNHKSLYTAFKGLALLPIFLLKYIDRLWYPSAKATRIASCLCAIAKK